MCPEATCGNISCRLDYVEKRLIDGLQKWLNNYKLQWENTEIAPNYKGLGVKETALKKMQSDLATYEKQLLKTHDLLEQEVYTVDMFLERSKLLSQQIQAAKSEIATLKKSIVLEKARMESQQKIIPTVERLLDVYWSLPSAQAKNEMLKEVLEKAVYTKTVKGNPHGNRADIFDLILYPRLPDSSLKQINEP